jgi:hypothetical protein
MPADVVLGGAGYYQFVLWLWALIAVVLVGLIAVVPRKRSWGPITYRRRRFVGGPVTGRVMEVLLFVALAVLVVIAVAH